MINENLKNEIEMELGLEILDTSETLEDLENMTDDELFGSF